MSHTVLPPAGAAALPQGVRRLVPIAHFDMVGYSRLIGAGEEAALRRIRALRETLFEPAVARHNGTVVQTAGDSMLVVFGSIVDAVRCAAVIQQRMPDHPSNAGEAAPIRLRVGIEMGDVIADRGDLHGEGVIVAVRLESACPPGAICVSRAVFEAVAGRLPVTGTALGALNLKNVARPVEAFALAVEEGAELETAAPGPAAALGIPGFGDRAAIAVLPFRSYGADDDAFTDGLTEELTDALAAWRSFPVISRHSTFAFRGRDIDVRTLGRDLGARYIVSGSVRWQASAVRVSVQLDDCETATELLRESFERADADAFALQDEAVRAIAGVLGPEIEKLERERAGRRAAAAATTPDVYALFTRGMWFRYRRGREDLDQAESMFRAALDLDPDYAPASAALSLTLNFRAISGWAGDEAAEYANAMDLARRAVADDPRYPHAQFALGCAYMNVRRPAEAAAALRHAIRLNPSHAYARANLGQVSNYLNRPDEALAEVEVALRLNPHDPRRFMWLPYVAASHYLARRYRQALQASEEALVANPAYPHAARYLLAALGQLGRTEEARRVIPLVRKTDPTLAALDQRTRHYFVSEAADHLVDGFRRAGFD